MRITIAVFMVFALPCVYSSEGVTLGYLTGNGYMSLSKDDRTSWAMGVADGIMAEAAMAAKSLDGSWLGKCLRGIPSSQLQAMIDNYITNDPQSWQAPAAFIVRGKLAEFCKTRG